MEQNNLPVSLDINDAAKVLGLTPQAIRVAVRSGKIKGYHPFEGCSKFVFRLQELLDGMVPAKEGADL